MVDSKAIGEYVEDLVVDAIDALDAIPDDDAEWHDAVATEAIGSESIDADVPVSFVGLDEPLEAGTPVEIKAARDRISDGTTSRRGRFQVRRGQHSTIRQEEAAYLDVVYAIDDADVEDVEDVDVDLLEVLFLAADVVDDALGVWVEVRRREPYTQISWGTLPFSEADRRGGLVEAVRPIRDDVPTDLEEPILEAETTRKTTPET